MSGTNWAMYSMEERDKLALKLYKFNEFVRKEHPEIQIRFTIYKDANEPDPAYSLTINGEEYFDFEYQQFSSADMHRIRKYTNRSIFREIVTSPRPEW